MSYLPPIPPAGPYREPEDPDAWREEGSGAPRFRPPALSTTQIIAAWILLILLVGALAFVTGRLGSDAPGAILSPEDGARLEPGSVPVLIRVLEGMWWEVAFAHPGSPGEWRSLGSGQGPVTPLMQGRGLQPIDASDPGRYEVRLIIRDGQGTEQLNRVIGFEVERYTRWVLPGSALPVDGLPEP